ncbi:glycosyltransferase family 32 protein [Dothistroma septosporum NZE10]|uniref:Glycosyltransferase family 32 protein n=1 Tax=Dothistroma septosporum (strain NZE10 / CBS 128990) TaxID=675120 RepID=M2YIK2_DOTSN|nr:glycosyltransferase family 32 protein [Dothistroma septosporum NZE10]
MTKMGGKARRRPYAGWFSGKYRMVSVFFVTTCLFITTQQVLRVLQRPLIVKPDTIPPKIWQSWKTDALHFEERDLDRARTWARRNPYHRYELLTDYSAIPYVREAFGCGPRGLCRPDIVKTYEDLNDNLKIIQADLLRYIIMYIDGGLWADIDVEDIQPIRSFIPRKFDQRDVDMVIGIETDEPGLASHPVLGSKAASFCQWTFMCKPGLPVMMRLIENIMKWLHRLADEQGKTVAELHLNFDEVLSGTGPSAFTAAILAEMSISEGTQVVWNDFHDLVDSQLVGGVLVLPSEAFAAGTGHSRSGNHKGSRSLVKHHFHASTWTDKHQRFKHPVYGEIEKCNWDSDCVALWDSNVAFYDSLPEEEQLRMIELKRIDDAKEQKLAKAQAEAAQMPIKEEKTEEKKADGPVEGKIPAKADDKGGKRPGSGSPPEVAKKPAVKDLKVIKDKADNIKIQKENAEKKTMPDAKLKADREKPQTGNAAKNGLPEAIDETAPVGDGKDSRVDTPVTQLSTGTSTEATTAAITKSTSGSSTQTTEASATDVEASTASSDTEATASSTAIAKETAKASSTTLDASSATTSESSPEVTSSEASQSTQATMTVSSATSSESTEATNIPNQSDEDDPEESVVIT